LYATRKLKPMRLDFGLKGLGVKHEKCAEIKELKCIVCGASAGCSQCEYNEDCNLEEVSQLCICKKCNETEDPFASYQISVKKKFPLLNLKIET